MIGFQNIDDIFSLTTINELYTKAHDRYISPTSWDEVTNINMGGLAAAVSAVTKDTKFIINDETYTANVTLANNSHKVWVVAKNSMGVNMQRNLNLEGNHIIIEGLLFTGGDATSDTGGNIYSTGNYNTITRNRWDDSKKRRWVISRSITNVPDPDDYTGLDFTMTYNEFINKTNNPDCEGNGVCTQVWNYRTDNKPRKHLISRNYWHNIVYGGSGNFENVIMFTVVSPDDGTEKAPITGMIHQNICSYNLFEKANGEGEGISNKVRGAHTHHNTHRNSTSGIVIRGGSDCVVEDNISLTDNGTLSTRTRISSANQIVRRNYWGNIKTSDAGTEFTDYESNYEAATDIQFTKNYLVGGSHSLRLGRFGVGAYGNAKVEDNIMVNPTTSILRHDMTITGLSYTNNTYFGAPLGRTQTGWVEAPSLPEVPGWIDLSKALTPSDVGIGA